MKILRSKYFLFVLTVLVIDLGSMVYKNFNKEQLKKVVLPVYNLITFNRANPEKIYLEIAAEHLEVLKKNCAKAANKGMISKGLKTIFPCHIYNEGSTLKIPCSVRLKGDLTDHVEDEKFSLRITCEQMLYKNFESFSLQHPKTRNFIYEWVFHQLLAAEGLCTLNYDFIELHLNNENMGIYAFEEHFSDNLLMKNGVMESPIVKFDESGHWEKFSQLLDIDPETQEYNIEGEYGRSKIDFFNFSTDPANVALQNNMRELLSLWRKGEKTTSEIFDVRKLSKMYAICDLMGSRHAVFWRNVRFFFNPETKKLEPIAFDGNSGQKLKKVMVETIEDRDLFNATMFRDSLFFQAYLKELRRVSDKQYLDSAQQSLQAEFDKKKEILKSQFPGARYSMDVLEGNQKVIMGYLNNR